MRLYDVFSQDEDPLEESQTADMRAFFAGADFNKPVPNVKQRVTPAEIKTLMTKMIQYGERSLTVDELSRVREYNLGKKLYGRRFEEGAEQQLNVQQLASISDEALDNAYHYGRSTPGNTFGWQANLKSAEFAAKLINAGETDIEKISNAIHQGWNVTAQAFVSNPEQFDDTEKLRAAGKLEAKLAQREKLMNIGYAQLPDDEQEKDRVVARALLQAIVGGGEQGVAEGTGQVEAYGYRYNNRDQRVVWRKNFPSSEAAYAWADKHNATVIGVRAAEKAVDKSLNEFAPGDGGDEKQYLLQLADELADAMYGPNKSALATKDIKNKIIAAGGDVKISHNNDTTFNVVMYHPTYFKQGHLIKLVGNGDPMDEAFRLGNKRLGNKRDRFKSIHRPSLVETEPTHRIGVTVTDPNHPMVSKRGETVQKSIRVTHADRDAAINRAIAHYRRKGYKVHDHHYMGTVEPGVAEGSDTATNYDGNLLVSMIQDYTPHSFAGEIVQQEINDPNSLPYRADDVIALIEEIFYESLDNGSEGYVLLDERKDLIFFRQAVKKSQQQGVAEGEGGLGQVAGIGINGKQFNFSIKDLIAKAQNYPIKKLNPQLFVKQLADRHEDPKQTAARAQSADLQYPIIVVQDGNTLMIADGTHRAQKAIMNKLPSINAYVIPVEDMAEFSKQGVAEGSLNEFSPGSGGGESGRWYTDDQITDLVGDGWYQDLDVSGDIPKDQMIQQAQAWLDDQGYSVQVLNCKVNDDDMEWYIEGSFHNPGFAKEGVAEDAHGSEAFQDIVQRANGDVRGIYKELQERGLHSEIKEFCLWARHQGIADINDAMKLAYKVDLAADEENEIAGEGYFQVKELLGLGQQGVAEGMRKWLVIHSGSHGEGGKMTIEAPDFETAWELANEYDLDIIDIKPVKGVAAGSPGGLSQSDYTPGATKKHVNTNCTTCHGRKGMYKLDGKLFADNKVGAERVKCPTCKGSGDKPGVAEAKTSAAVRLGRAIDRTQGKTAASQARSVIPSSIPKKEEPKRDEKKVDEGIQAGDGFIIECGDSAIETVVLGDYLDGILIEFDHTATFMLIDAGITLTEAEYHGRTVPLGKRMAGDVKKSKVYVKKPNGNVVKVNFGDKNMTIKKHLPKHRKSYRARHHCENPGPKWKANYWSCRAW
jgi:mono/diheme cytochrome c family protein